jgi:hypothetical protein
MSQTLTIVLAPDVAGSDHALVQNQLEAVPGIVAVRPLAPQSLVPQVQRMWIADIADNADLQHVATLLRALPDVESASAPAPRGLDT